MVEGFEGRLGPGSDSSLASDVRAKAGSGGAGGGVGVTGAGGVGEEGAEDDTSGRGDDGPVVEDGCEIEGFLPATSELPEGFPLSGWSSTEGIPGLSSGFSGGREAGEEV